MFGWLFAVASAWSSEVAGSTAHDTPPPAAVHVVSTEGPASVDELLALARRRLLLGDTAGAQALLVEVSARPDAAPHDHDIAYLQAAALEFSGALEPALAAWDALLAQIDSEDIRFRRAETLAALGRTSEALVALDALGDLRDRLPTDQAKVALLRATWALQADGGSRAVKAVLRALDDAPEGTSADAQARALVGLMQHASATAEQITFVGSDRKKEKALTRRVLLVRASQERLVAVIRLQQPRWTLDAFLIEARMYHQLGDALWNESAPRGLTEAQQEQNRKMLLEKVANVWMTGLELAKKGADFGVQSGYVGPMTDALRAEADALTRRIETTHP